MVEANPSVTLAKINSKPIPPAVVGDAGTKSSLQTTARSNDYGYPFSNLTDYSEDEEDYLEDDDSILLCSSDEGEAEDSSDEDEVRQDDDHLDDSASHDLATAPPLQYNYKLKKIQLSKPQTMNPHEQQLQRHELSTMSIKGMTMRSRTKNGAVRLLEDVRDDFNFKGFGVSLYKSFLYARSAGMSFRLPLLSNFDWWDSRPYLPSLNFNAAFYIFPLRFSLGVSSSVPVEGIRTFIRKWLVLFTYEFTMRVIHHMLSSLWTLWTLLVYPWTQKWEELPERFNCALNRAQTAHRGRRATKTTYDADVMERLGWSFSWRWSPILGYDTRTSYWHMYAPQMTMLFEHFHHLLFNSAFLRNKDSSRDIVNRNDGSTSTRTTNGSPITEWLRSLSSPLANACLGVDTSIPNPIPPNFFMTGILSMSGFGCRATSTPSLIISPSKQSKVDPRLMSQPIRGPHPNLRDGTDMIISSVPNSMSQIGSDSSTEDDTYPDTEIILLKKKQTSMKKSRYPGQPSLVARGGEVPNDIPEPILTDT
jgi:hypothetical protein